MVEIPANWTVLQEKTATSSNLGSPTRIQFLQIPYRLQDSQRFLRNLQYSSSQVAQLPVQWMPFPQYPLRSRMEILFLELQELQDNPGHPEEAIKEFHPQGSDSKSDIFVYRHSQFRKGDVAI